MLFIEKKTRSVGSITGTRKCLHEWNVL